MGLRDLFRRRRNTTVQRSTHRGRFTRRARFESLEQRMLLAVWPGTDPSMWKDIDPNLLPKDDDPLFSIGDDLAAYYREYEAWDGTGEFAPTDSRVRTDNGLVSLRLMVGGDGADFVEAVEAIGMKVVETDAGKLTGWIPTDKLDDLAAVEGINTAWSVRLDPIGDVGDGDLGEIVLDAPSSEVIPPPGDYSHIGVRVGFRTDAKIDDIETYVASLDWPAEIGVIQPDSVKQLLSFPWMQEDGTFQTIARFDVITSVGPDVSQNLIDTLEGLEFISYAKLESEHPQVFTDQMQRSVDAITTTASQERGSIHFENEFFPPASRGILVGFRTNAQIDDIEAYVESLDWPAEIVVDPPGLGVGDLGDGDLGEVVASQVRITFWTQERITDLASFVEAQPWPEALGPIKADNVEQLISIPVRSQPRGGYLTIVRMDVFGDIAALDGLEFIEHAKLESESLIQFGPNAQEHIDGITTGASKEPIYVGLAQSEPLINLDDFRSDQRFSGIDGSGYATVILDTGIDLDHSFFGPDNDSNGVADRIVYQHDYVNNDNDASDDHGHGTNVTGIAASEDGTYTGVAPGADIVSLKVLNSDAGWYNRAKYFDEVHAFANDLTYLNGSSGNDTFYGDSAVARMWSTGSSWYNNAQGFDNAEAHFENYAGGDEWVYLNDSSGNDLLQVGVNAVDTDNDWVKISSALFTIWVEGLNSADDDAEAHAINGGTDSDWP